ncbi:MAG: energy-coupling factor transporter ATPase [Erysipelotrichia bacterium]|nr:energy-coupling factor transporter ATPase [Erysipelotrichia bacterium]NCC54683.1 energy-coupling factor transporter ATPase [Erysipelotrichia bacterium]
MPITCKQLTHIYNANSPFPYAALHEIDLEIKQGVFTAIIGETGSGKSTLVQHLNALLIPTSGSVEIDEYVVSANKKQNKNLKQLRKKVGLVFQFPEYQLFEETILKDVCFGPKNFGLSEEEAIQRSKEVLKIVGLDESYLERSPFDLSGGQKRRVAIAGILAADPDILVLDEPTAGLDPQGAKEMMQLFQTLNKKHHKTIIMVTHDMEHVLNYCKEVIVLKEGRVHKKCTTATFFKNTKLMESLHITPPSIIQVKQLLEEKGIVLEDKITSMNTLVKAIKNEVIDNG